MIVIINNNNNINVNDNVYVYKHIDVITLHTLCCQFFTSFTMHIFSTLFAVVQESLNILCHFCCSVQLDKIDK